ncbi:rhomboid-related protein 2-like [Haliotis rufescens]|uniref:rhomboid-related protein 2-like n=1 Tax=Haliotis rufescens TaxID=6454 RepID=UPI00201F4940|nr:rhomboid-related protein 2-like [Haliotis rufescens]XP_046362222.2 rhomboid-related protein 2-like [Haliotis rufescens]
MYSGGRLNLGWQSDRVHRAGYSTRSSRASRASTYTEGPTDPVLLRRTLEEHFRPLFQGFVYGGEQITNNELRQHLLDDTYRRLLPRDKLYAVMDLVDYNPSKSISYVAFVRLVTGEEADGDRLDNSDDGASEDLNDVSILYDVCRNTTDPQDLLEFSSGFSWLPPPFFILLITVAQIIVYAVYASEQTTPVTAMDGVPIDSPLIYNPARRYEVWRFISYTFLHQGYVDLLLTVILQILICFPLEIVFSFWRIAILYIIGVMSGSLLHSISDHKTSLVGGSGGTYCILAAHFGAMIYNWKELKKADDSPMKRIFCHPLFRMVVIVLLGIIQISLALYRRFFADDIVNMGIGHFGGGILAGAMLCEAFLKDRHRYPWYTNAGRMNLFMFLIFAGACAVFNCLYLGYPAGDYS